MSDLNGIKAQVKEFILREFLEGEDPDELTDSTPLISGGILDSISILRLVDYLEAEYSISMAPHESDAEHLDTIADIAQLVTSKMSR